MHLALPTTPGRRARRTTAAVLAGLTAAAGTVLAGAPAHAATLTPTAYAVAMHGYATRITSPQPSLVSSPTAYSETGCTRYVGHHVGNSIAQAQLNNQVQVGTVTTHQDSWKLSNGDALARSTTKVASVVIGDTSLGFKIIGLQGVSQTRGTKAGHLSASNTFTFGQIAPLGTTQLPYPLNQPVDVILKQLAKGPVTIPHLGVISLGGHSATAGSTSALAWTIGLSIKLFGPDQAAGGTDDSTVYLARSWSWMSKSAPYGLFHGAAWGIDASVIGGAVTVGRNIYTPMPCQGTGGKIVQASLATLDLAAQNQLVVSGMRNRVYGKQGVPTKGLTGWTDSTIAGVDLGGALHIGAIHALAKIVRNTNGTYHPMYSTSIGSISYNGTRQALPKPGQPLVIQNVAQIEVGGVTRTTAGVKVTALKITLLGGSAANTVINLGHAEASAHYR